MVIVGVGRVETNGDSFQICHTYTRSSTFRIEFNANVMDDPGLGYLGEHSGWLWIKLWRQEGLVYDFLGLFWTFVQHFVQLVANVSDGLGLGYLGQNVGCSRRSQC